MAVMRINKTTDYTVMSNYHFREKDMSLKAKGLLSLMLSLPEDWDFTVKGVRKKNRNSISRMKNLTASFWNFLLCVRKSESQ